MNRGEMFVGAVLAPVELEKTNLEEVFIEGVSAPME
jgi:hypothetical protein